MVRKVGKGPQVPEDPRAGGAGGSMGNHRVYKAKGGSERERIAMQKAAQLGLGRVKQLSEHRNASQGVTVSARSLESQRNQLMDTANVLLDQLKGADNPEEFASMQKVVNDTLEKLEGFEARYAGVKKAKDTGRNWFGKFKRGVLQATGQTTVQKLQKMKDALQKELERKQAQFPHAAAAEKSPLSSTDATPTSSPPPEEVTASSGLPEMSSTQKYLNDAKKVLKSLEGVANPTPEQLEKVRDKHFNLMSASRMFTSEEAKQAETYKGQLKAILDGNSPAPAAGGGGAAAASAAAPEEVAEAVPTPPTVDVLPGLPNGREPLVNVCYMNGVTQQIAAHPAIETLVLNAKPQDALGKALQRDLLALVQTMKRGGSEQEVFAASKKYWETFQRNLAEERGDGLFTGVGKTNDTVDFIRYLGKRLGVDEFYDGQQMASWPLMIAEGFPTKAEGDPKVILPSFPNVQPIGYNPPEQIIVNGKRYTLQGIINKPQARLDDGSIIEAHHFTSTTKSTDGRWVNQDDAVVTQVPADQKDNLGVYVMFYVQDEQ
ncbi:hypothetical protein K0U07_03475 [bacterium]|nr:hypothetical protein [bacterium]